MSLSTPWFIVLCISCMGFSSGTNAQASGGPFILGIVESDSQEWSLELIRDSLWMDYHIPLSSFGSGDEFLNTPVTTFKLVPVGGGTYGLSTEVTDWIDRIVVADTVIDDFEDANHDDWVMMIATNGSYLDVEADTATPDGSARCLKLVHGNSLWGNFAGWIEKSYSGLSLSATDTLHLWLRGISYLLSDVEEYPGERPLEFALSQNYPNPFNAETRLNFTVGNRQPVVLKIYDNLGREIGTLVDGPLEAGTHEVVWSAEGLASGVYLVRLQVGDVEEARKMVLLR